MNLKEIKEIISLMNENGLSEIELEREGMKVKIRKNVSESSLQNLPEIPPQYHVESAPVLSPSPVSASAQGPAEKNTKDITSPMVGTFYRAPSPESASYVEVGQIVEIGQVVCIVEAMKLMNEIKSEVRGKVKEIPIENAQPVEFGQVLFVIESV